MLEAKTESPARERASGQQNHIGLTLKRRVPPLVRGNARTPLNRAALAYFLWHASYYPGVEQGLFEIFQGRAKIDTIRKWKNGKRKAPAWARALLREALEKRIAELEHARALLA